MTGRIFIGEALNKWNEIDPLLKRIVAEDGKWVTYENIMRKRAWSKRGDATQTMLKGGLSARKIVMCIWWNCKEIIWNHQTLNSNLYSQQLNRLKPAIE